MQGLLKMKNNVIFGIHTKFEPLFFGREKYKMFVSIRTHVAAS
jgi:hypothetical protein